MSQEKHNKQSLLALCLIPLGIIFLGYLFMKEPEQGNSNKTKSSIYTLWIAEAEVAPTKNDDSKWDVDGTAPVGVEVRECLPDIAHKRKGNSRSYIT